MARREAFALGGLAAIAAISAAWWALALWPAGDLPPDWLLRTRAVCFGTRPDGLPGPEGWGALIFQPLGMAGILLVGWRQEVVGGLRALRRRAGGRMVLGAAAILAAVALVAAAARVHTASAASAELAGPEARAAAGAGRAIRPGFRTEDRPAPALGLVDQRGATVTLDEYAGRPLLVTFAFGHCETICPLVVRETIAARRRLAAEGLEAAAVVLTLDPWRDTPGRLAYLADRLGLADEERLLGGDPHTVEAALDRWGVPRERDLRTGDIVHVPLVYVVDAGGRIAFAATGGEDVLADLVRRTRSSG